MQRFSGSRFGVTRQLGYNARVHSSQHVTTATNEIPALKEWSITIQALLEGKQQVRPISSSALHVLVSAIWPDHCYVNNSDVGGKHTPVQCVRAQHLLFVLHALVA
jgi:hypothetical protein